MTYEEEADAIIDKLKYPPLSPTWGKSFMSSVPPTSPIIGELWLDTTIYMRPGKNGDIPSWRFSELTAYDRLLFKD